MTRPTLPTLPTPCPGKVRKSRFDLAIPLKGVGKVKGMLRDVGNVEPA